MTVTAPLGPDGWLEFYDPDLYEQEIGPGIRVGPAYAGLLAKSGLRTVAEYGCGPGEILVNLARAGHVVTGIDRSAAMVDRARLRASEEPEEVARRITVLHAGIEGLRLPQPVDAVLMTNEFVLHLLDPDTLVAALAGALDSITPGGRLILDLPIIDFELLANAAGKFRDQEFCRGYFAMSDGTTLRVSERIIFSTSTWEKEMTFKYERIDAQGRTADSFFRRLRQRVWTVQEIRFALALAGAGTIAVDALAAFPDRLFIAAERSTGA
jgi:SAM-dependent methyltransferase